MSFLEMNPYEHPFDSINTPYEDEEVDLDDDEEEEED